MNIFPTTGASALVAAIVASVRQGLDEAGTGDMLSPSSWPDWATHAVTFRDVNVDNELVSRRGTQTRFFPTESHYYEWMATSMQMVAHTHSNSCRQVFSYRWDLGPELMCPTPVHMYGT